VLNTDPLARPDLDEGLLAHELRGSEPGSWLATDEQYHYIRNMFASNRIVFIPLNLLDADTIERLYKAIVNHGLRLDSFYISSIYNWLSSDGTEPESAHVHAMRTTLSRIGDPDTLLFGCKDPAAMQPGQFPVLECGKLHGTIVTEARYRVVAKT
jgi:hypothetical protein